MKIHLTTIILALLLNSCVSVELKGTKTTSAKDVQFREPASPFREIKAPNSDRAWLSERTGNTISFASECGNAVDPSLSEIESESLSVLSNLKVTKAEEGQFNGRGAQMSSAIGEVDGVPVQISLLVFKKNGCNYVLSYSGVQKQFSLEEKYFQDFVNSFKAP